MSKEQEAQTVKAMNPEVKEKLLKALRSGRFTKGKNCLAQQKHSGEYLHCFFGVICELAVEEGVVSRVEGRTRIGYEGEGDPDIGWSYPPSSVRQWAGFGDSLFLEFDGRIQNVIILNDAYTLSFQQLADMVEEQL